MRAIELYQAEINNELEVYILSYGEGTAESEAFC